MNADTFAGVVLSNLALALLVMLVLWLISLVKRDASIVDPYWGFGFVVLAWATFLLTGQRNTATIVLLALVTIWGVRLSAYLTWRNLREGEDRRYRAMREKHGDKFWWVSLLTVFGFQGLIMWFVSLTFQSGMFFSTDEVPLVFIVGGGVIWAIGVFFETVADVQMVRFKSDPANVGKVLNRGLWKFSRHPNYFGDFCVWWGLYLIAAPFAPIWIIACPLLMTFFLLQVSGVAHLEKDIGNRRPEYADYIRTTSAFFPLPPRTNR